MTRRIAHFSISRRRISHSTNTAECTRWLCFPIWAALVLALLNTFLKPILQILSLPVTILTLGLFLIIINTIIVMLCSEILDGFEVSGFFQGILFSIILTIITSLLNMLFKPTEN